MSWLGSLAGGLSGLLGKASGLLSNPAVNVAAHLTGAGALTDMINGANAIANKLGGSSGYSDLEKLAILNAAQNANSGNANVSTTTAEDKAAQDSIDTAEQEARANTTSAINAGVNKSKAGMLGEAGANEALTSNYNDRYNAYKSGAAGSQADYLRSMGQTYDQVNQLNNASKGQSAAIRSGALSGAAQGLGLGMSLSDETAKQPAAVDMEALIERFKNIVARAEKLKQSTQENE